MAKPDTKLYKRLRKSGVRKKAARRASEALPAKGKASPETANEVAAKLARAADDVRTRAEGSRVDSNRSPDVARRAAQARTRG